LLVPARSILADDGTRVARFELLRPLKRSHITEDQLAESSWDDVSLDDFPRCLGSRGRGSPDQPQARAPLSCDGPPAPGLGQAPVRFREGQPHLGGGWSLAPWPGGSRPLRARNCAGRWVSNANRALSADDVVQTVLATGRAIEFAGREQLMVKRSLVNGSQRLELTGWSAARLDWYKAQGCFTEIIRYQTRLFVPIEGAASVIARLAA
jgi:hypothetical protein